MTVHYNLFGANNSCCRRCTPFSVVWDACLRTPLCFYCVYRMAPYSTPTLLECTGGTVLKLGTAKHHDLLLKKIGAAS